MTRTLSSGNRRFVIVTITIRYFAILREQSGQSSEELATSATTAGELYAELRDRYHFSLPADLVRVAINEEYSAMTSPLQDGDGVVFIPPVSGG